MYRKSAKRNNRKHECDKCRGLDKMLQPHECVKASNREAQWRARKRKSESESELNDVRNQYDLRNEFAGVSSYLFKTLTDMTHVCGWNGSCSTSNLRSQWNDIISNDSSGQPPCIGNENELFKTESGIRFGQRDRHVYYNGSQAPCQKCDDGRPKNQWCYRCKRVDNNRFSANCRSRTKLAAMDRPQLLQQVASAETAVNDNRRMCQCLVSVIRDLAWCPACAGRCSSTGDSVAPQNSSSGSSLPSGSHNDNYFVYNPYPDHQPVAIRSGPSPQFVVINEKPYEIEGWIPSTNEPGPFWARDCLKAARNFYRNFDTIQYQLACLHPSVEYECTSKSRFNTVVANCVLAMNSILEANLYTPFGIVKQLGLQQELIKNSFQVIMMLHRIFLTSKYFRKYDDNRLMLTSGTYGKILAVSGYLRDVPVEEQIRQEYASKKLSHWITARRIAMEMAEMEMTEADVAYLMFYFMLEEAKRVLHSRTEYRLANIMKMYRDSLMAKWNQENYGRPLVPYGVLTEVVKLVSDVHITHLKLRMRAPGLSQNDAWDDDYVLRLLQGEH